MWNLSHPWLSLNSVTPTIRLTKNSNDGPAHDENDKDHKTKEVRTGALVQRSFPQRIVVHFIPCNIEKLVKTFDHLVPRAPPTSIKIQPACTESACLLFQRCGTHCNRFVIRLRNSQNNKRKSNWSLVWEKSTPGAFFPLSLGQKWPLMTNVNNCGYIYTYTYTYSYMQTGFTLRKFLGNDKKWRLNQRW